MRVALFGGTFDPPHRGHLAVARAAADQFALDRVLFAPAGRQPLKSTAATASFEDRLAMVALACEADPRFIPSTLDEPHPDGQPNYTVDTLTRLAAELPDAQLFAIAGVDSFLSLDKWRHPYQLLTLAEWIVVSRPGFTLPPDKTPDGMTLDAAAQSRIHLLTSLSEDVAATNLRERLHHGESCHDLLPAPVAAYIAEHGLYR